MTVTGAEPAAVRPGAARRLLGWAPLGLAVIVAVAALAVGTHRSSPPASLQARTLSVAAQLHCETCVGETAAESQATWSVVARQLITQRLAAGQPPAAILAYFEQRYGPSVLERPSSHGAGAILWVGPIVAVAVAAAGLVLGFSRWRRSAGRGPSEQDADLVGSALSGPGGGPRATGGAAGG